MNEMWKKYKETGIISTNEDLIQMMQDLVNAKKLLKNIKGSYYDLVSKDLLAELYSLTMIARARDILDFPSMKE